MAKHSRTTFAALIWRVVIPVYICMGCAAEPSPAVGVREEQIISVARLKELGGNAPVRIDSDHYIRAGVVSDDRAGNIYKSIVLEDSTGGIELKIDLEDIFTVPSLRRGRTVVVRCNSLVLGRYGGSPQLGGPSQSTYQVEPVGAAQIFSHVIPAQEPEREVYPHVLETGMFSSRYINCYVRLCDVQFVDEELPGTWGTFAGDIDRHLVTRQSDTIAVRISARSELADKLLPAGSGWIEGILGRFNGRYQLRPLNYIDNSMNGKRFVPQNS